MRLKPLALMLCEALEAPTPSARNHCLQRLGDVSLFIAGFFAQGFAAKLIDIDYHIAMGGRAYGTLAESTAQGRGRVLAAVFAELAQKFQPLVDALNEVSESAYRAHRQGHPAPLRDVAEDRQRPLLRRCSSVWASIPRAPAGRRSRTDACCCRDCRS